MRCHHVFTTALPLIALRHDHPNKMPAEPTSSMHRTCVNHDAPLQTTETLMRTCTSRDALADAHGRLTPSARVVAHAASTHAFLNMGSDVQPCALCMRTMWVKSFRASSY